MHFAQSEEIFHAAALAFFAKYRVMEKDILNLEKFLDYMQNQWFDLLEGWYIGFLGAYIVFVFQILKLKFKFI